MTGAKTAKVRSRKAGSGLISSTLRQCGPGDDHQRTDARYRSLWNDTAQTFVRAETGTYRARCCRAEDNDIFNVLHKSAINGSKAFWSRFSVSIV